MSKGSTGRPFSVSNKEYASRWDAIFGRDNEKKDETQILESDKSHTARHRGGSDNTQGEVGQTQNDGVFRT
jgi:hypothetical protein